MTFLGHSQPIPIRTSCKSRKDPSVLQTTTRHKYIVMLRNQTGTRPTSRSPLRHGLPLLPSTGTTTLGRYARLYTLRSARLPINMTANRCLAAAHLSVKSVRHTRVVNAWYTLPVVSCYHVLRPNLHQHYFSHRHSADL